MDSNQPDHTADNPLQPGTPAMPSLGGDVLSVINDVERRLFQLRDAHMETERVRSRLEARERELTTRAAELDEKSRKAAAELGAVDALRSQVEARQGELDQAQAALEQERQALVEKGALLQRDREAADAVAAELLEQEQAARAGAAASEEQLAAARTRINELEHMLAAARTDTGAAADLEQRIAALQSELTELSADRKAAMEGAQSLERERDEALSAARTARDEAQQTAQQAAARVQELDAALRGAREGVAAREARLRELQAERQGDADATRGHAEKLTQMQGVLEARTLELQQAAERVKQLATALEAKGGEAAQRGEQASRLQREVEAARADLKKREEALAKQLGEQQAQVKQLQADAAGAHEALRKAKAAGERLTAEKSELTKGLDTATSESLLREQLLGEARAEGGALQKKLAATAQALTEAKAHIAELHDIPDDVKVRIQTRRDRMHLVRRLLREQQGKLRTAGDALRDRFRECEQILARREELAAARAAMVEVQRKLERMQGRAAKSKASTMTVSIVAMLGLLGGISWGITTQMMPATYAVKAVVEADGRGRDLSSEELTAWRAYHEGLLSDPAFMQATAQRMGARGITSLGTPGLLAARLKTDLKHDAADGTLRLELMGEGEARTCREMETFVTSLASYSNAGRERRADGIATVIPTASDPGRGPVLDKRPMYAAGVFAGAATVCLVLGFGVWRRLAAAKIRFEEESQIDAAIDEVNWGRATTFKGK